MKLTCQSEVGKIDSVFIKRVDDAFVDNEKISKEWEALNYLGRPDIEIAKEEYGNFEAVLRSCGVGLSYFPQDASVSLDSLYCRDASLVTDHGMIICNMGKPARANEPSAQKKVFEKLGFRILGSIQSPGTIEGGDVVWLDEQTLAVGYSYRSNAAGIDQLKGLLSPLGITVVTVPLPHYRGPADVFHLMSILSPVDHDLVVVYSPLMPIVFRNELLERGYRFVEVPKEEFDTMAANVLSVAPRKCIMLSGNTKTRHALEKAGCTVLEYEGEEISIKGGGGPTCLTRPMWRQV
ncbi:MAG: arginine deiminase family protein [Cyclobacteriaceae bacterium]|jgi:N-dimethylarginine dimethylaminohydrolase|nr:arginine deiminase family protein [Cyclobacteriaceae bacterium]MDH4294789.1 arginine deiminase family protein [Cyclobacteriaceae bacterium]MDH5249248.1 arginine deiminase family protein [Cyclobacteriaceae bacterium]